MKILAVDFDGVISDSALKALFVSHNVYCKYSDLKVKKNFVNSFLYPTLYMYENSVHITYMYMSENVDHYK